MERSLPALDCVMHPDRLQPMAAICAVKVVFLTADVKGCFFHYCQAIWRKVQDLGLAVAYREDPEVCKWIRRAAGLPLLPQNKIQDTWIDVMDNTPDVLRAVAFNDYIVTTWVDHGARFPLPLWNHHGITGPRTNNSLEGFHNRLNRGLPHQHPNIYRFVEVVRKVEQAERAKFLAAPRARKRVYREVENRLCRLKDELNREVKSPMQV
ncbi:uncharacterized protein LOC125383665 [Haliotis rufescens]|uniref:uncharacterized protein LOC125383661 n=1 Tax=Haliotis rufescens TaxID=6454 RepID=UPI00201E9AE2|nr:uncharacterized protein LOC125383661 [Haliotis rufescens]XP_048258323.1 uncharacterized protein LOC125383665 [Haliotis rufescens]